MENGNFLRTIRAYKAILSNLNIEIREHPESELKISTEQSLRHCRWMLNEAELFFKDNDMIRAYHHLGFVHGILWSERMFSVSELKNQYNVGFLRGVK